MTSATTGTMPVFTGSPSAALTAANKPRAKQWDRRKRAANLMGKDK
jgi:hypothetical protein